MRIIFNDYCNKRTKLQYYFKYCNCLIKYLRDCPKKRAVSYTKYIVSIIYSRTQRDSRQWSRMVSAAIASTTGTARGTTQGS